MSSIAAAYNVWRDAKALRGSLEASSGYFDNIFVLVTPPGGEANKDDETCDLLREFGIDPKFGDINKGYGVIRSRLVHECGCEFAMILDSDERFRPSQEALRCVGTEQYPKHPNPALTVKKSRELIYPGLTLKDIIKDGNIDAVKGVRRHWFDFSHTRPSQNWHDHPDWQLRIVRNRAEIHYDTSVRMHERLIDSRTKDTPRHFTGENIFWDHYHLFYRRAHPGSKEWNEQNYQRLERGDPMLPAP